MSNAPLPTRAEEAREADREAANRIVCLQVAKKLYEAQPWLSTKEAKVLAMAMVLRAAFDQLDNMVDTSSARAARAEAEVARLKETNRDLHRRAQKAEAFKQRHRGGFNYVINRRVEDRRARRAAEAEVARLTERVAVLEGALKPFAKLDFSYDGFSLDPAVLVFNGRECGRFWPKEHAALHDMIKAARAALHGGDQ